MTKYAATIAVCALLGGCSGSGTSTSARDDMGDAAGTAADDGGDGNTPADDGVDDGVMTSGADDGGTDAPADGTATGADDGMMGTTAADADTGNETGEPATFEGVWLSEGDNIAPLLVQLTMAVSITGTFTADTFTVFTTDSDGNEVNQSGVYTAEASGVGEIYTIMLEQTVPQQITVEGIYEIDNSVSPAIMRYEVVQTSPSVGAQTPTAELGFGGTDFGADLTQIFVRQ